MLADGTEPPIGDVQQTLDALGGKTVQDLRDAVNRLLALRQAQGAVDRAAMVPAERAKAAEVLGQAKAAFDGELRGAQRTLDTAQASHDARLKELDALEKEGAAAQAILAQMGNP
jgi:hypothetical protein